MNSKHQHMVYYLNALASFMKEQLPNKNSLVLPSSGVSVSVSETKDEVFAVTGTCVIRMNAIDKNAIRVMHTVVSPPYGKHREHDDVALIINFGKPDSLARDDDRSFAEFSRAVTKYGINKFIIIDRGVTLNNDNED